MSGESKTGVSAGGSDNPRLAILLAMAMFVLVVDTTLFYRLPIESGRWQAVGSMLWGEADSDVAFHDNEIFMISAGVMYRFGAR